MNYLAHALLSTKQIDFQVANVLADTLKSKPWPNCSNQHVLGLDMHKKIDSYTDANLLVKQAKKLLGNGYLRGIVIDIFFDHMLSKHWDLFVGKSFDSFVTEFYLQSKEVSIKLPEKGLIFINRLVKYDFFYLYDSLNALGHVFEKFDLRLSSKLLAKDSAVSYLPVLAHNYNALEKLFLEFFPDLINVFLMKTMALSDNHFFNQSTEKKGK